MPSTLEHQVDSYDTLDNIIETFSAYTRSEFTGDCIVDCIFFEPEYWSSYEDEFNDVVEAVFGDTVSTDEVKRWSEDYTYVVFYK